MSIQLQPPVLPVNPEPLAVIKNEPPESEIGIDDIVDSSSNEVIPDIKRVDIVSPIMCSIKSETVLEPMETQDFVNTENVPFVKVENNITESENTNKTDVIVSSVQEVVEVQIEVNPENIEFAECYKPAETASSEKNKEKIKVIEGPVIPVEPHEYTSLSKDKHVCNHCQRAYSRMKHLNFHIRRTHRDVTTMYQCSYCPFMSKWRLSVRLHIIQNHKDTNDIESFQYHCDKCNYETYTRQNLNRHKIIHLKPEEVEYFYCHHCSYKSKQKFHLKTHISRHFKNGEVKHEKRYHCEKCNYKTYRQDSLDKHKLIHLKPEEIQYFYCYHCSLKCKRKDQLRTHILMHFKKGEIKFYCYLCDFMALRRDLISEHIKQHSKVQ